LTLSKIHDYFSYINSTLEIDILAEFYAALLVENENVDFEDVFIIPKDNKRRSIENDISSLRVLSDENYDEKYLEIKTSRFSTVNALPEGFFLEQEYKTAKTEEEKQKLRKDFQAQLESAYNFFIPIEVEYNRIRIKRAYEEYSQTDNIGEVLYRFWGIRIDKDDIGKRFLKTLHLLPYIVGDKLKTSRLLEYIFEKEISIEFRTKEKSKFPENLNLKLGNLKLSIDTYLNNEMYLYEKECLVTIGGLNGNELFYYLKGNKVLKDIIERVEKYYFPIDVNVTFDFETTVASSMFFLDTDQSKGIGILGYSTRLN